MLKITEMTTEDTEREQLIAQQKKEELNRALKVLNFYKHRNRSDWQTQENTIYTLRSAQFVSASQVIDSFDKDDEVISLWPDDVSVHISALPADLSAHMLYMTTFEVIAIAHYYINSYKNKYQDINKVQISDGRDADGDYTGSFRVSYVDNKVDMTIGYYDMGSTTPLVTNYNCQLPAELILARVESLLHQKAVSLLFGNLASSRPEAQ